MLGEVRERVVGGPVPADIRHPPAVHDHRVPEVLRRQRAPDHGLHELRVAVVDHRARAPMERMKVLDLRARVERVRMSDEPSRQVHLGREPIRVGDHGQTIAMGGVGPALAAATYSRRGGAHVAIQAQQQEIPGRDRRPIQPVRHHLGYGVHVGGRDPLEVGGDAAVAGPCDGAGRRSRTTRAWSRQCCCARRSGRGRGRPAPPTGREGRPPSSGRRSGSRSRGSASRPPGVRLGGEPVRTVPVPRDRPRVHEGYLVLEQLRRGRRPPRRPRPCSSRSLPVPARPGAGGPRPGPLRTICPCRPFIVVLLPGPVPWRGRMGNTSNGTPLCRYRVNCGVKDRSDPTGANPWRRGSTNCSSVRPNCPAMCCSMAVARFMGRRGGGGVGLDQTRRR